MRGTPAARPLRFLLSIGAEVLIAVGACLVFFSAFLVLLGVIFPQGTGLSDLIGRGSTGLGTDGGRNPDSSATATSAVLTVLNRDVRTKRADEIAWRPASSGIVLAGGDGVQTSSRGEAQVAFDDVNQVRLGQNTLIVIKEPSRSSASGRTRSAVAVLAGELWAEVPTGGGRAMDLQIEAGGARARVRSGSEGDGDRQIKVTVGPNKRSTFSVMGGTADIEANGKMVRLSPNEYTTVDSTGPVAPLQLLQAPVPLAPDPDANLNESKIVRGVTFIWEPLVGAESYRLTLARDEGFERVFFARTTTRTAMRSSQLGPGDYYWKVSGVRAGVEGIPSSTRGFTVQPSRWGPALRVQWPAPVVYTDRQTLSGVTLPGVTVLAGGRRVVADANGRFKIDVKLERGVNAVVVEAIDARGNATYASTVVNAKFE